MNAITSALLLLLVALLAPQAASAAGTPNLSLSVASQDPVLFGKEGTVKLTASTPGGAPEGYNLSYRVVVPANVSYVPGSAGPTAGEPTRIANQPGGGQTTLLWVNVADLAGGTKHDLDLRLAHSTASFGVQGNYTVRADAYVHDVPTRVPAFTATGTFDAGAANPATGRAENVTWLTRFAALAVTATSDQPEEEVLRGIHENPADPDDDQPIYTVTVRGNAVQPVTSTFLGVYLPAGLEFLGCGGTGPGIDRSSDTPTNPGSAQEYAGAGAITVPAVGANCAAPTSVSSSTYDPDGAGGPLASGIWTEVRWSLLTLSPNATVTMRFRAAIPLRSNTATWRGATPATSGAQTANLNNNSGPEVADEAILNTYAKATGFYNGQASLSLSGDATLEQRAEDLAIRKKARSTGLAQGSTVLWDLDLRTSEYREGAGVIVTDTLPDGLCPLSNGATLTAGPPSTADTAECASAGPTPSGPYSSATERADGSWELIWNASTDPALAQLAPRSKHRITFPTATRTHYQEAFENAGPVLSGDAVTNTVAAAGSARVACTVVSGTGFAVSCPSGGPTGRELPHDGTVLSAGVTDASLDRLSAASPTLDKRVASTSGDCSTAAYTDGTPVPAYRPGDRICWLLRIAYPGLVSSNDDTIVDYLPPTLAFDPPFGTSGETPTAADTAGAGPVDASAATPGPGGELRWAVPGAYVSGGGVFERQIATRVQLPAGAAPGDVATNLLKSSSRTTGGPSTPLRDTAPYKLSMPVMSVQKRIVALNGTDLTTPVATQVVRGYDVVKFGVQLTNASDDTAAEAAEVWDALATGVTCADVTASGVPISDAGVCDSADNTIKWGKAPTIGPSVGPTSGRALTYSVRVPTTTRPTEALTSRAGLRSFQTTTNTGSAFTYIPSSNVDPTQNATANVGPATSSATLTGAEPTVAVSRTTSITESEGGVEFNSAGDATIGETIRYSVATTIPAGLTVGGFTVADVVDARHTFLPATLALTTGALPAGGSLTTAPGAGGTNEIRLDLGPSWTAPTGSGDTTFTFTFDAIVADSTDTFRSGGLPMSNVATLSYDNPGGTPARNATTSAAALTNVVEPVLTVKKKADVGTTPVIGGQTVEYTVDLTNGTGAAGIAHDSTLVDVVQTGLTPLDVNGDPVVDGASTLAGGVWNATARTITFTPPAAIVPGRTVSFVYRARVDVPPVSGSRLRNTVTARTSSLAGTPTAPVVERSIASTRTVGYTTTEFVELTARTPSITSRAVATEPQPGAAPGTITPGEQTTVTLTVTIPANTVAYDTFVREALPPELEFDSALPAVCTAGCIDGPTTPTVQRYSAVNAGGNTQVIGWDIGDLAASSPQPRTIELAYKAHLRTARRGALTSIIRPATATTAATVSSNRTDRVTGPFDPTSMPAPAGGFSDVSAAANAMLTTVEPVMAVDKQIAVNAGGYGTTAVTVHDGDVMKYRVTVRNGGDSPAYDVAVKDVPHAKFRGIVTATGVSTDTNVTKWQAPGDTMGWLIPGPIMPNASVVLEYTADLPVVTDMKRFDSFVNTATIEHSWGVTEANRTLRPGPAFAYRDYNVGTIPALRRTTTAIYDAPAISVVKTTGISPSFPKSGAAEVNKPFTWRVAITNTSSTAAAKSLTVRDVLPRDWRYEAGSAVFSSGSTADPTVNAAASGDELVWNTAIPLAPNASVLLTYRARATVASATSIGTGVSAATRHINSATASVLNTQDRPADGNGLFAPAAPDTAYVNLAVPIVTVAQTPDLTPTVTRVAAGNTAEYVIKVKNTGAVAATNVVVTDTLPADGLAQTYVPGSATSIPTTGFTELASSDTAVSFRIATLAVNGTYDIRVPIKTDPAAPENTDLVNSASVVSDQTDPVVDTGTVRLIGNADLQASKKAQTAATPPVDTAAVAAGQNLSYVVGAKNLGPSVARDVVLTDVLPATVDFRPSPGCTYATGSRTVTCTIPGVLAVGDSVSATINVRVRPGISTNANNTVTAASATADPVAGNNAATALVDVGALADLSLVKTITGGAAGATAADPWTKRVLRGDEVEFGLEIENKGPSDAPTGQVVDTLPAGLDYVSDDAGCTYAAGTRRLTCSMPGGIPSHDGTDPLTAPRTIKVVTKATGLGNQVNSATVSGGTSAEPTPPNNTDTAEVMVDPAVELGLTTTAAPTVGAGELLTYTLTGTNTGKDPLTEATLIQTLPAGTVFDRADPGCTFAAPDGVTCAVGTVAGRGPLGTGPIGSVVRHVTVRVPIALAEQAITSNVRFAGLETGLRTDDLAAPVAASASTQVGPAADLSISQDAPAEVTAGGSITYTVVVRNDGPSAATDVVLRDTLPGGTVLRAASTSLGAARAGRRSDARAAAGPCDESGGVVTCALGTMTAGTSTVLTFTVDVPDSLGGQSLTNLATVSSPVVDPTPANASSSRATRAAVKPPAPPAPEPEPTPPPPIVPGTANLVIAKKADGVARAGRELGYSITATNRGPAVATDVVVTDALVGGVEFKNARAGDGKCGYTDGSVRCKLGRLAVGESVNMRVIVVPSKTGMLVNDAVVSSAVKDPDMADNRAVAMNSVSPLPPTKVAIKAKASSTKLRGGQRVTYTLTVRNTGPNAAVNVEVCDKLPAGMSFTSTKGGVFKGSRLCFTKASLAPRKTVVFKVKVRLSARARKGSLTNRASADAENAAVQNATVAARVLSDGKVGAGAVRGFTG